MHFTRMYKTNFREKLSKSVQHQTAKVHSRTLSIFYLPSIHMGEVLRLEDKGCCESTGWKYFYDSEVRRITIFKKESFLLASDSKEMKNYFLLSFNRVA